jgi:hypothetical protein
MKHKPSKDHNAGQQAAIRAFRRWLKKRTAQYEADGLQNEAYVLIEAQDYIGEYVRMCSKRCGGSGKK